MLKYTLRLWRQFKSWKQTVWDEKTDFEVPLHQKITFAIKGFSANEYVWYNLKENDYRDYISEYERLLSRKINGDYKFILDNKLVFEEVFGKYTRVPKNYALISDGKVFALHGCPVNSQNFYDFLFQTQKSIMKWIDRGGGSGTYLFEAREDMLFANGKPVSEQQIHDILVREGNALLCEYITQSDFSASLYPYTTNTIRIVCARKKGERNSKIVAAIQRIGCEASIPVDNVSSGGMTCAIDLDTGTLSYGIAKYGKMENRMERHYSHPDTRAQICGKVIPDWAHIKQQILELTQSFPYLNFVAWDVLLTEDGFCVIEGNASSSCDLFQMEHGVRNSDLGDIYRSYGIIK